MDDTNHLSGRFVLRMPPELHETLRVAAAAAGLSLNEYCVRRLRTPARPLAAGLTEAVSRCDAQFGERLVGIAVFGSWARGEAGAESDVDLLVVASNRVPIRRELYRLWDSAPLLLDGHAIEPHFVHLPGDGARVSSIWAEIAIDGIILLDREFQVARRLNTIRHEILAGRIRKHSLHGQTYWVHAA